MIQLLPSINNDSVKFVAQKLQMFKIDVAHYPISLCRLLITFYTKYLYLYNCIYTFHLQRIFIFIFSNVLILNLQICLAHFARYHWNVFNKYYLLSSLCVNEICLHGVGVWIFSQQMLPQFIYNVLYYSHNHFIYYYCSSTHF